jgi:Xaa-Pro aminopeptidase
MGNHSENIRYLTNVVAAGYMVFPFEGDPTLIGYIGKPGGVWVPDWRTGHPKYSKAISERIGELNLESARIGVTGISGYQGEMGFPYTAYMSLTKELPRAHFEDASGLIEGVRRIKSDEEIKCFELGCEVGNKVLQAIVNTAKPGVNDYEVRAVIKDTIFRNGCDPDSMVHYASGKEVAVAQQQGYLQPAGSKVLQQGDVMLTEFDASYLGYQAQYNQTFSIGQPDKEWSTVFDVAAESFNNGMKILKPGITAGELDEALLTPIRKSPFTYKDCAYHGVGLAVEEPMGSFPAQPSYEFNSSLVIQSGMVIELEPRLYTQDRKKGVALGSAVLVTDTGCRLLDKKWKPEFMIA